MKSRYVEIKYDKMAQTLEDIGFSAVNVSGCVEYVWERQVEDTAGKEFPYTVRVYSSVDKRTNTTRDCGADAIRVVLMDLETGRAMKLKTGKGKAGQRIYRTKSALINLKARCREYFVKVIQDGCPECGAVMAERAGKFGNFLGCTKFPACKGTRKIED